jgi:hypothetical protein
MALVALGDTSSMVDIWLSTLFTLFGLITAIIRLHNLLKGLTNARSESLEMAEGWPISLPTEYYVLQFLF